MSHVHINTCIHIYVHFHTPLQAPTYIHVITCIHTSLCTQMDKHTIRERQSWIMYAQHVGHSQLQIRRHRATLLSFVTSLIWTQYSSHKNIPHLCQQKQPYQIRNMASAVCHWLPENFLRRSSIGSHICESPKEVGSTRPWSRDHKLTCLLCQQQSERQFVIVVCYYCCLLLYFFCSDRE